MLKKLIAGLALSGLFAAGISTAAYAVSVNVNTAMILWENVSDFRASVDDAEAFLTDFRDTGLNIDGWTNEAFDAFLSEVSVYADNPNNRTSLNFSTTTPVSTTGGVTSGSYTANYSIAGGTQIGQVLTDLTIQGNFVRFTFNTLPSAGAKPNIRAVGQLGSDSNTVYTTISPNTLVSHDSSGSDLVIGYNVTSGIYGGISNNTQDQPTFLLDTTNTPILTVALLDYDPCSLEAAIAEMVALVPTFGSIYGSDLEPQFDPSCYGVSLPAGTSPIVPGEQVDLLLPLEASSDLGESFSQDEYSERVLGQILGLPTGLNAELIRNSNLQIAELRIHGSTTQSGTFNVTGFTYSDDGLLKDKPLTFAISLSVELAKTGNPTDELSSLGTLAAIAIAAGASIIAYRRQVRKQS